MVAKRMAKILGAGSSSTVALPPDWLRAEKLKKGEEVEVLYDSVVLVKHPKLKIDYRFLVEEFLRFAKLEETEEHNSGRRGGRD
jgi:antitoxin component of MazEF toxin-antitoxin module